MPMPHHSAILGRAQLRHEKGNRLADPCRVAGSSSGVFSPPLLMAATSSGLTHANLQPKPSAATRQTAFTNHFFPKSEPSVSHVATGTAARCGRGHKARPGGCVVAPVRPRMIAVSKAKGEKP